MNMIFRWLLGRIIVTTLSYLLLLPRWLTYCYHLILMTQIFPSTSTSIYLFPLFLWQSFAMMCTQTYITITSTTSILNSQSDDLPASHPSVTPDGYPVAAMRRLCMSIGLVDGDSLTLKYVDKILLSFQSMVFDLVEIYLLFNIFIFIVVRVFFDFFKLV